ncbi:MAG TPA: hypothetical protein DDZ38_05230 [Gammaproteobacteria bacterium]|nr:hypothetical protein [Gammaproteobacteria bacterium]
MARGRPRQEAANPELRVPRVGCRGLQQGQKYPGSPRKGPIIHGLGKDWAYSFKQIFIFGA